MRDLLAKLSSYDLFNYLLTGIVFAVFARGLPPHDLAREDLLVGLFLYYFIGLALSRIGSLLVEPLLRWLRFVTFADYADYVVASRTDEKLHVISESNNTYRTLCTVFATLLILRLYGWASSYCQLLAEWQELVLLTLLLLLFGFSYRKQTSYVRKRVEIAKGGVEE